jgi:hypothetical protein
MSGPKICVLAVCAVSAPTASAASVAVAAPEWTLNGTPVTKAEEVTYKLKSGTEAVVTWPGWGVTIRCSALKGSGAAKGQSAQVEAAGKGRGAMVFEGCTINIAKCEVTKGELKTEVLTSQVREEAGEVRDVLEPPSSHVYLVLKLKGTGCPLTSGNVTGALNTTIEPPFRGPSLVSVIPGPRSELEFAGMPLTLEAETELAYQAGGEIGLT